MEEKPFLTPRTIAVGIGIMIVLIGVFGWLFWQGPWLIDHINPSRLGKDDGPKATVVSGLRSALVTFLVGTAGLVTVGFTAASFQHNRDKDREQTRLTREGQITDRYVKAVGLLASPGDKAVSSRVAGIYALERLMRDSEKDHETIVQLLAAFVREHAARTPECEEQALSVADDVQAALTVLGRRPQREEEFRVDLSRTYLRRAELSNLRFDNVNLHHAILIGSVLIGTDLRHANFWEANLGEAVAHNTDFREATFDNTVLTAIDAPGAKFGDCYMRGAQLDGAILREANLDKAYLVDARFIKDDGTNIAVLDPKQLYKATLAETTVLHHSLTDDPVIKERIKQGTAEHLGYLIS